MLRPGQRYGDWVVERYLGGGAVGAVYLARDPRVPELKVALKVLVPNAIAFGGARLWADLARRREVRHPALAVLRGHQEFPPHLWFDPVVGQSLEERLEAGPLAPREVVEVLDALLEAVDALHRAGLAHGDVKAGNVLVADGGHVYLVDQGLCLGAARDRRTWSTLFLPSLHAFPPEVFAGRSPEPPAWDLYGLGILAWRCLTGRRAFPAEDPAPEARVERIRRDKERVPWLDPGEAFPDPLRRLVAAMTARDPARRPRSVEEVREQLALVGEALPEESIHPRAGRPRPGIGPWGFAFGVGLLLLAGGVAWWAWRTRPPPPPPLRDLQVLVDEELPGSVARVLVDGKPPSGRMGRAWVFRDVPIGPYEVAVVAGAGCDLPACPGDACPACCTVTSSRRELLPGAGMEAVHVPARAPPPAAPRPVRFEIAGLPDGPPPRVVLDGVDLGPEAAWPAVEPGVHRVEVLRGRCPPAAAGCHPDACPPGCLSAVQRVVVPCGAGPAVVRLDLPPPER